MKAIPRQNGFTLPEILVTIGLLAMIIAAIAGGLRIGARAWQSGRKASTANEAETLTRTIAAQIERAMPVTQTKKTGAQTLAFIGAASSCRFVALSEGDENIGGLITTEIAAEPNEATQSVIIWTSFFRAQRFEEPRSTMRKTPIVAGLTSFRLEYFGANDPTRPPRWRNTWTDPSILPDLVSITIEVMTPTGRHEATATSVLEQR